MSNEKTTMELTHGERALIDMLRDSNQGTAMMRGFLQAALKDYSGQVLEAKAHNPLMLSPESWKGCARDAQTYLHRVGAMV